MDNSKIVLKAKGVSKHFGGIHALENVDFELRGGEVMGLVGDNGAGKSTLIKVISGVYPPDRGSIEIYGKKVSFKNRREARDFGVECVYQDLALVDSMDAPANVFLGSEIYKNFLGLRYLDNKKMQAEARITMYDKLKIRLQNDSMPVFNLSGGQKQAVAIARAIYNSDIKVLILDEPTAALGPEEAEKILDLAKNVAKTGIPVILITHNIENIYRTADRVSVLCRGKMVGICEIKKVTRAEILGLIMGAEKTQNISNFSN